MPLQYVIPVSLTVLGDGESTYIAFDLAKDYTIIGENVKQGWLGGKLPSKVSTDSTNPMGYEVALRKGSSVLYISFPSAPKNGVPIPVTVSLIFDGEDREEPKPSEVKSDEHLQGKQSSDAPDLSGQ